MLTELGATYGVDMAGSTMVVVIGSGRRGGARGGHRPFRLCARLLRLEIAAQSDIADVAQHATAVRSFPR
jgi:hypothetical protein